MDTTSFDKTKTEIDGPMHTSLRHDSAHKHVTGSAEYIDDIPEPAGLIHGALGMADRKLCRWTSPRSKPHQAFSG